MSTLSFFNPCHSQHSGATPITSTGSTIDYCYQVQAPSALTTRQFYDSGYYESPPPMHHFTSTTPTTTTHYEGNAYQGSPSSNHSESCSSSSFSLLSFDPTMASQYAECKEDFVQHSTTIKQEDSREKNIATTNHHHQASSPSSPSSLPPPIKRRNRTDPELAKLTREERRRRRRATTKYRLAHATRERIRVEAFNSAFSSLRLLLPTLPPDKKLSKIEILRLAICYIGYLNHVLDV